MVAWRRCASWWHIEVRVVQPYGLVEGARLRPHLVVCSRLYAAMPAGPLGWIMPYPDGEDRAEIFTAGERATVDNVELSDLLSFIDRVVFLR